MGPPSDFLARFSFQAMIQVFTGPGRRFSSSRMLRRGHVIEMLFRSTTSEQVEIGVHNTIIHFAP